MSNLAKRLAVVIIGLPIVLTLLSGEISFKALLCTANAIALWEFQFNLVCPFINSLTSKIQSKRLDNYLHKQAKRTARPVMVATVKARGKDFWNRCLPVVSWAIGSFIPCVVTVVGSTAACVS